VDLSSELHACLSEFTAAGAIELRENGGRLAPFSGMSWEVRGAAEKPLRISGLKIAISPAAFWPSPIILEFYERDPVRDTLEQIDPRRAGNPNSWLVPHRESQVLLDRAQSALEPVVELAPRAIRLHPGPQSREVWLRFRGLAFEPRLPFAFPTSILKAGGEMKFAGLARNVEEVLKVTQLYHVFPEFSDEEAVLQSFPANVADKPAGNS
jgi:hypothetical protein